MRMSSSPAVLLYREPDLTRDPSGPNVLLVPSLVGNSLPEREKVRRRPPVAKLHCKAFQFPVSQVLLTAVGVHVGLTAYLTAYLNAYLLLTVLLISASRTQVSECLLGQQHSLVPTLSPTCHAASRCLAFRIHTQGMSLCSSPTCRILLFLPYLCF